MKPQDKVEVRLGMQSAIKTWGELTFYHIGAKNKELQRIHDELVASGVSTWEGITIIRL